MDRPRTRSKRSPTVIETAEESQANLAAGEWDDFDHYLERMAEWIEKRAAEIERGKAARIPSK